LLYLRLSIVAGESGENSCDLSQNNAQPEMLPIAVAIPLTSLPDTFKMKGKSAKQAKGERERKNGERRARGAVKEEGSSSFQAVNNYLSLKG
jgi:hypothetical protein